MAARYRTGKSQKIEARNSDILAFECRSLEHGEAEIAIDFRIGHRKRRFRKDIQYKRDPRGATVGSRHGGGSITSSGRDRVV